MRTTIVTFALLTWFAACGGVSSDSDPDAAPAADGASVDAPVDGAVDAAPVGHIVFTTSSTMTGGQFTDRLGMSAECQRVATAAGRNETFVALLHLRSMPIDDTYLTINGPVVNTNGDTVAADAAAFFSGNFLAPNNFSESGGAPGDTVVWVGDPSSGATCGDWSSTAGQGGQGTTTGTTWLATVSTAPCTLARSIQCISQ